MRYLRFSLLLLLFSIASALRADHLVTEGDMNATMNRGESKTFFVKMRAGTGSFNGKITVTVSSSPGLHLVSTRTTPTLSCQSRASYLTTCSGDASVSGGSELVIEQTIRVASFATASIQGWNVQFIGDGLSGQRLMSGAITIPSGAAIFVMTPPLPQLSTPNAQIETTTSLWNAGDVDGTVTLKIESPVPSFQFPGFADTTTVDVKARSYFDVRWIATAPAAGEYRGTMRFTGVVGASEYPLALTVTEVPGARPKPETPLSRVDVVSAAGASSARTKVEFTNSGAGPVRGVVISDSPWARPCEGVFTIEPGETRSCDIDLDLTQRPDHDVSQGSLKAMIRLKYLLPLGGSNARATVQSNGPSTSTVGVTLVSTVQPVLTPNTTIPPKTSFGALFVTGVGRVVGSVGQFITDMSLYTKPDFADNSSRPIVDLNMYFTPLAGSPTHNAAFPAILPPNAARFGDLIGNVYGGNQQIGTLQIRTLAFHRGLLGVSTAVFNVSNKAGTYGTSIPLFSSQFAQGASGLRPGLFLVGLRKDATGHTNFYLQETEGAGVNVAVDFYDQNGTKLGSLPVDLGAYGATQLGASAMPDGTASAMVRHTGGNGRFQAYATPVDRASGDTWAVADWASLAFSETGAVVIPVAGAVPGVNNTFFRTDVAIMNTLQVPSRGTLRFYNRAGGFIDKPFQLGPMQTLVLEDATTTFFGIRDPHIGHLVLTAEQSFLNPFVVTARNYTATQGTPGTFGTAVPPMYARQGLGVDSTGLLERKRVFGGIDDAALTTVAAAQPATFRSNLGLVETEGKPVRVKVTIYFRHPGARTSSIDGGSASFDLAPNQFLLLGNIARAILGAERRDKLADLSNIQVEVEAESGEGRVIPFVSSIDNGTGDSIFRLE